MQGPKITAEHAQAFLEKQGYSDDLWDELVANKIGGHVVQSLILVARGDERELVDIYNEQRLLTNNIPVVRDLALDLWPEPQDFIEQFSRPMPPKGT